MSNPESMFDNKRNALALLVCFIVVMIYTDLVIAPYNRRLYPPPTPAASATAQTAPSTVPAQASPPVIQTFGAQNSGFQNQGSQNPALPVVVAQRQGNPTPAEIAAAPRTVVETATLKMTVSHLGARLQSIKLHNYKLSLKSEEALDLVSAIEGAPLPLGVYTAGVSDAMVAYQLEGATFPARSDGTFALTGQQELSLNFVGTLPNGSAIRKIFKLNGNTYLFTVDVQIAPAAVDGSRTWLEWARFVSVTAAHDQYALQGFTLLDSTGSLSHRYLSAITEDGVSEAGNNSWVTSGDKYFLAALIPSGTGQNTRLGKVGDTYVHQISGTPEGGSFTVYVGPKDFQTLSGKGFALERAIDLGIFTVLASPLLHVMRFLHTILGNWGLAIIALTLLIKAAFLPLTKASFKSMQAMQDLQPEMKALRERVTDSTQLNKEMMELYKRRGVNPMGGCLPVLIQIPVFLGLYNALLNAIELRHAPFALWIQDLSAPESPLPVMLLLMSASMLLQQWLTPSSADPQQKKIMMIMPVVFTVMFIIVPLPSGLVLYWLVNNSISIIQQVYLKNDRKASPFQATLIGSGIMLAFGYILTLL
jgi:YidC/Oxa1 family membrane protein insertase